MTHAAHNSSVRDQVTPSCLAQRIAEARSRLCGRVVRTPTTQLHWIGDSSHRVWGKLECQQETGSFKFRGALNALLTTPAPVVVTASAGNHALAVCRAARAAGKTSKIIVPVTVSELKAKRILAEANEVIFYGNDLAEATTEAIRIEELSAIGSKTGKPTVKYVSPYDDLYVAAGAGTLMSEAFEDAGPFDQVIVPLGGGGLAAAVASWCRAHSPSTKVICVHPKIFCRSLDTAENGGRLSRMLHLPTQATLCDGLAVQLVRPTQFADILDSHIDQVVEVSEDAVLAGIALSLRYQSLLIEGSSAAAISAITHEDGLLHGLRGKTLVLLTGGNLSSNSMACALVADVADPTARQQLGLRNITNPSNRNGALDKLARKAPVRGLLTTSNGSAAALDNEVDFSYMIPKTSPEDVMDGLCDGLDERIATLHDLVSQRRQLSSQLGLDVDFLSEDVLGGMVSRIQRMVLELRDALAGREEPLWVLEERYRTLIICFAAAESMGERASASNDQAKRQWFFRTTAQHQSACNYDRYGVETLRAAELMFLRSALPSSSTHDREEETRMPVTLLMASSGMAAFQIVWQYVMHQLRPGDRVTLPPYIYFEAMEQIVAMGKMITVDFAQSFHGDDIIRTAEETGARVVFLDPVANVVGLPCTDIRAFFKKVTRRAGWKDRLVVIDGTMISGGLSVFDWASSSSGDGGGGGPTVLYHESASKYAQLGLDIQMAGFCVAPSHLDEPLRKIRRDTGGVLSRHGVACLPSLTPEIFQARLAMLTRNAESVYRGLQERVSHVARVAFPDSWREFGWRHGGALVTIEFLDTGLNNREGLEACIDLVLQSSVGVGLPITKGVSFGFSTSRISASSSMAENTDPFLRISVGIDEQEVHVLTDVVAQAVVKYVSVFSIPVARF